MRNTQHEVHQAHCTLPGTKYELTQSPGSRWLIATDGANYHGSKASWPLG